MYAKKTKLASDVDLNVVARGTTGFSGADLYNLMNQAALKVSSGSINLLSISAAPKIRLISFSIMRCYFFPVISGVG
jgi:SpoVK/Ycf46/Vps4 family AAA+-type ATPase